MVSVPTRASGRACGSSIGDGRPEGRCVSEICVHCASARFRPNARAVVGWEKERLSVAASHPAGASRRALRCCVITLCTEKRGPCVSLDDCSPSRSEAKLNRGRLCSNSIRSLPPPHHRRHQSAGEQDPASGPLMTPRVPVQGGRIRRADAGVALAPFGLQLPSGIKNPDKREQRRRNLS